MHAYPTPESDTNVWRAWAESVPLAGTYGVRCTVIEHGIYECVLEESQLPLNPNGAVNGGVTAAIADLCMGMVAVTVLAPSRVGVTAALTAEYHRPAFLPLTFRATLASSGQTLLFVDVDVLDAAGRVCVRCHGTMAARHADLRAFSAP